MPRTRRLALSPGDLQTAASAVTDAAGRAADHAHRAAEAGGLPTTVTYYRAVNASLAALADRLRAAALTLAAPPARPCRHPRYYTLNAGIGIHRCTGRCGYQFVDERRASRPWDYAAPHALRQDQRPTRRHRP